MDVCENSTDAIFDDFFVNFTLPPVLDDEDNTIEDHACMMYQVIDPTQGCVADNFNQSHQIACSKHVFSPDVPYAYSLVEEMDLPSCTEAGNWPLKVNMAQQPEILGMPSSVLPGGIGRLKSMLYEISSLHRPRWSRSL